VKCHENNIPVMELDIAGKLKHIIVRTFPLKEAAAQEPPRRGENFGKITLDTS
jgi:hypothetical protein